jgi:hypothetical protein
MACVPGLLLPTLLLRRDEAGPTSHHSSVIERLVQHEYSLREQP